MKRTISFVLVVMMVVLSFSAMAEEFTLHSGVKFGMTVKEVMQVEKDAGFEVKKGKANREYCSDIHQETGVQVAGQIAGVDDATIEYHFDNDGKLDSAQYALGQGGGNVYYVGPVKASLIEKYGNPDSSLEEKLRGMKEYMHLDVYNRNASLEDWGAGDENVDYWLVPQEDDSYVLISYYATRYMLNKAPYTVSNYHQYVGYQYFTQEEFDAGYAAEAAAEAAEAADAENRSNQRDNDL